MATVVAVLMSLTLMVLEIQGQDTKLDFRVREELPSGQKIGSVSSFNKTLSLEQLSRLRYQFLKNNYQHLFTLNDSSGDLYTMVVIDRESVCSQQLDCILDFTVAVMDEGILVTSVSVTVHVEDINDHIPTFTPDTITLLISEGSTINASFSIPSAEDNDTGGKNGIQSYAIVPESDMFGLTQESRLIGFNIQIYVKKALDREITDSYKLQVVARDGGSPPQTGYMTVDIIITDVNDNKPQFSKPVYNISIEEDTPAQSVILTLSAKDKDSGVNGIIFYQIAPLQANKDQIMNDFSVNSTTGDVAIKHQLIYEANKYYSFIVEAYDNGENRQVSQAQVYVYVSDAGNNPPKVSISTISPGNTGFVNISENSKLGTFVAYISTEDSDTGPNGIVSCVSTNSYFAVNQIAANQFSVVVQTVLDRETSDIHNVTVMCSDHGTPVMSSSASFIVRITDYNDNVPVFDQTSHNASVYENSIQDQVILQVKATDRDIGSNKDITYRIDNEPRVTVNQDGVVIVKPSFDREVEPFVLVRVLAIDNGNIPLTGTATISLTILDRNDNSPYFVGETFQFEIVENLNSGTSITRLKAEDKDIEENSRVTFSLSPSDVERKLPFTVFADGVIQSNRALDREEKSLYDFIVIVQDQGEPSRNGSKVIRVIVLDVNDNRPNITFPNKENKSVSIIYPDSQNSYVAKIFAYDVDFGDNASLIYQIVHGNELGIFEVDPVTGVILVSNNNVVIDHDLKVTLGLEVKDKGPEPLTATAELIVSMAYSNASYAAVESSENKFVIISVVVIIVTVLISAAIIGVILLLRYLDKKRKSAESDRRLDTDGGFKDKPSLFIINNAGESSTDYGVGGSDASRKKKEVSFSLDDHDSLSNYQQEAKLSQLPDPIKFVPEKPPRRDNMEKSREMYDKETTRLESLKLQQMLMETRAKQIAQLHHHPINPDDSRSETSGETIPSDSGRGASEEEGPSSPTHDDQKMFDYSTHSKFMLTSAPSSIPPRPSTSYSTAPPPIPSRTYKPYASFNNYQNYSNSRPYYELDQNGVTSVIDNSALHWQQNNQYSNVFPNSTHLDYLDYSSLPSQYRGSVKSHDDDDCSTTTSGSYTLQTLEDLL